MQTNLHSDNLLNQIIAQGIVTQLMPMLESQVNSFIQAKGTMNNVQILTPEQTAELLTMSLPTLNNLVKKGILKRHKFKGTRRFYFFKEDVITALKEPNKSKKLIK